MKIEKISENQIKFILNQLDLNERGIQVTELITSSEKTHSLLREIMDTAVDEFDFETEGVPLMIEAIPTSAESVMIIVTKILDIDELGSKLNLLPKALSKPVAEREIVKCEESKHILIYTFKSFDDVDAATNRLDVDFSDESRLYKKQDLFYLILENEEQPLNFDYLEPLLSEYGERYISTEISKYHIFEHGEAIIKRSAVNVLNGI